MNYEIAIPSYKRPSFVVSKTLKTLTDSGSDLSNVTVFVADEKEKFVYDTAIEGAQLKVPTVVGVPGLHAQRVWYNTEHYSSGTPILNLDDDLTCFYEKDEGKIKPLTCSIDQLATKGFEVCEEVDSKLWGINPVPNGFFMKEQISVGLRFICGVMHGSYAGDEALIGEGRHWHSSGEDFETTLRNYTIHGRVVRFDGITMKSKFFAEGGMQSELGGKKERDEDNTEKLHMVVDKYPGLARIHMKANGVTSIRLTNKTEQRIPFSPSEL